jgi:hypothetical protein
MFRLLPKHDNYLNYIHFKVGLKFLQRKALLTGHACLFPTVIELFQLPDLSTTDIIKFSFTSYLSRDSTVLKCAYHAYEPEFINYIPVFPAH